MNDRRLVDGLVNKNVDVLESFILQYSRLIYGVIGSILNEMNEKSSVEECYNDVLLIIWYKSDSYDKNKGLFKNWIISITKFKALDYKRKYQVKRVEQEIHNGVLQDDINIEQLLVMEEKRGYIIQAIDLLDDIDRYIFKQRFLEENSIETISKALNMSPSAIYTRLSRGKQKLKKLMEGYDE
jgi:RNA polymerase sigma-70 factor, ECF subfamily